MRRNKKAGKPIAEQPLSELQEAILEAAATNDFGIATLAEVPSTITARSFQKPGPIALRRAFPEPGAG